MNANDIRAQAIVVAKGKAEVARKSHYIVALRYEEISVEAETVLLEKIPVDILGEAVRRCACAETAETEKANENRT